MTMIADNLHRVWARISAACTQAGRTPDAVTLLAVSKTFDAPAVREAFEAGQGGALVPLMCVDKRPEEITSFVQLRTEADAMHGSWRVMLAGALSGQQGAAPTNQAVDQALERLLGLMQAGRMEQVLSQTLAFTRDGQAVTLKD